MSEKNIEKVDKKTNTATEKSLEKKVETPIVSKEKVAEKNQGVLDETAKIKAEAERMFAEAAKAKAEAERMLAEAARVKAEAENKVQKSDSKHAQMSDLSASKDTSKSKEVTKKVEKTDQSKNALNTSDDTPKANSKKVKSVSKKLETTPKKAEQSSREKSVSRSLNDGLENTRSHGFLAQIGKIFKGELKSSVVDELEEILFTADIGVKTAEHLLDEVTANLKDKGDGAAAMSLLRNEVESILKSCEKPFVIGDEKPHVILTIGVNGAGKTTTLGKMASQLTAQGKKVLLIAGDTFRAAAIEQLEEWAVRCGCEIYRNKQGADPSGTIFDGIKYAQEHGFDVALADTAGRLNNKKDLIEELKKIHRVSGKAMPGAPHQVLLVLDATNGQNALAQARDFGEAIDFDGIILTKLDGTAKGGVLIGICEELKKPVYFIGIGEMIEDLRKFEAEEFVEALFLKE